MKMANIKSSKKNSIKSIKRKKNNNQKRSIIKTYVKKVRLFILSNNLNKSLFFFKKVQSLVDKYASKKIIHKNKAARYKSNLYTSIKNIQQKLIK
jgi:small subunit ribosomal protein S20